LTWVRHSKSVMRAGVLKTAAVVAATLLGQASPAVAQGFLQQLFGLGSPAPASQAAPSPTLLTPGGRPYTAPGASNFGAYMSRRPHTDDDDEPRSSGGYRTLCVRTCDGYFFPISNSTSKKGFYRDNMRCRAQCGDDARIFYLPNKTTEIDGAVDLQGRQYGRMNTAYVYRKTLVAGCQCKPDPWAASELARHQQYADAETEKKLAALPKPDTTSDSAPETATDATAATTEAPQTPKTEEPKVAVLPAVKAKPNTWKTTTRTASKPSQQAQRPPTQQASTSNGNMFGGGMGLGGQQLTWPGDAPRRP
jgi:Protein of unknown function (DUF2865)